MMLDLLGIVLLYNSCFLSSTWRCAIRLLEVGTVLGINEAASSSIWCSHNYPVKLRWGWLTISHCSPVDLCKCVVWRDFLLWCFLIHATCVIVLMWSAYWWSLSLQYFILLLESQSVKQIEECSVIIDVSLVVQSNTNELSDLRKHCIVAHYTYIVEPKFAESRKCSSANVTTVKRLSGASMCRRLEVEQLVDIVDVISRLLTCFQALHLAARFMLPGWFNVMFTIWH